MKKKTEPLKSNCFRCHKEFFIKFVVSTWNYSRKNSWVYWTDNKEDKDKKICDSCLLDMYHNHKEEYLGNVSDHRKRSLLRTYIHDNTIKEKDNVKE